jgi:hypothetical protein
VVAYHSGRSYVVTVTPYHNRKRRRGSRAAARHRR